jgi:hypothetical protein
LRSFISRFACPDTSETRPFQYGGIPVGLADSYAGWIAQLFWRTAIEFYYLPQPN